MRRRSIMEDALRELGGSSHTPLAWNLLAGTTAAVLVLCLLGLRCRLLRRCKLGSLLILRWICAADLCFIVHRIVFFLLNAVVLSIPSHLVLTWTCKLYHAFESLLMLVQTWLLVLLAMERATMKLRLRLGLRYFSRLRLRVGVAIAGMLAFSLHINYIYVFAPIRRSNEPEFAQTVADINRTVGLNGSLGPTYSIVCSVDFGFETFYSYAKVAEVLLDVYLPVLIINSSAIILCLRCAARGFTKLGDHVAKLLPPGATVNPQAAAFVGRCNNVMDLLFLLLSLGCYLPLEFMGVYKVLAVHKSAEDLILYDTLYNIFLPAKNLLDALVIGGALIYLLSVAKLRCPVSPRRIKRPDLADRGCDRSRDGPGRCEEPELRTNGSGVREPMELVELNLSYELA